MQGYVTARERMSRVDLIRLASREYLSALFGDATVEAGFDLLVVLNSFQTRSIR